MSFPPFLGPITILNLTAALAVPPAPGTGGFAPGSQMLNFNIQPQLQANWCWAAVSTSVSVYYQPASLWTQCTVADGALQRADCCLPAAAADRNRCNRAWYLDHALAITGNLDRIENRALTFAEVQTEIGAQKPIGVRVGWNGGGGHFLVVRGWIVGASGIEYIELADPIYLNTQIDYADFASAYQSGGDWTDSYLTRPVMAIASAKIAGGVYSAVFDPRSIGA